MVRRDQPSLAADDVTHPLILLIRLPPLFGMPDGRPLTRISAMLHRAIEDAGRRRVRHTTFGALTVTMPRKVRRTRTRQSQYSIARTGITTGIASNAGMRTASGSSSA